MTGSKLLLSSNIAIYLSKRVLTVNEFAQPGDILYVSLVSYMEVVGYKFDNPTEELFTNALFNSLHRLPVTQSIADLVINYRKLRKIKLPDAIIMATARAYDCKLVTRNVDDFEALDNGVVIINPFTID